MTIAVGIIGASGYVGAELLTLLARHPNVAIRFVSSREYAGRRIIDVIPQLDSHRALRDVYFSEYSRQTARGCDVVFFATPHNVAMREVPEIGIDNTVIIDLSADFRLRDTGEFLTWYGEEHQAVDLLPQATYGLTEYNRDAIATSNLIACPGCYATAVELALLPIVGETVGKTAGKTPAPVIVDAKSGVSGAGRRSDRSELLYAEMAGNFMAYSLDGHRHCPEIRQMLREHSGVDVALHFIPHLLPVVRGMAVNLYVEVSDTAAAVELIEHRYRTESFIDVSNNPPRLSQVVGHNSAKIYTQALDASRLLIMVMIDNLVKGASGQAIQNMNCRFGWDEALGLSGARTIER